MSVIGTFITLLLIASVAVGVWVVRSSLEAQSYNRLTGADATTWEAMWVQLRVQGTPNREP